MTDPQDFVDRFHRQAEGLTSWWAEYEKHLDPSLVGVVQDTQTFRLILHHVTEMLATQAKVNEMMLAALDGLRKA